ncbi:MAG: sigma 54-interacting transcriptional regulator, partial [Rectinema sp.]|nr:sigma 54-interacting transcriptional regulator [Rectinema sp.]
MNKKIIYFNAHATRLPIVIRAVRHGFEVLPATCLLELTQALKLVDVRIVVIDLLDMHMELRLRMPESITRALSEMDPAQFAKRPVHFIVLGMDSPTSLGALPDTFVHCLSSDADDIEIRQLLERSQEHALPPSSSANFPATPDIHIIGQSPRMQHVIQLLESYASRSDPVLILGETGTGKELAARALHRWGIRKTQPFVALNCATIPEPLFESEMFGTERGAFTDSANRSGAIEQADGGTLFLDEISSLAVSNQPRLLRVLETGEYRRLGNSQLKTANFRLVSASCENPIALAEQNQFREDLLFRIAYLVIELPPLRDRKEDIPLLARHFCATFSNASSWLEESTTDKLFHYDWPGNVRELR